MQKEFCTVNGVVLSEHLKDKELISEQVEREKLFEDGGERHRLYNQPRLRYEQRKEENGEVRILGIRETNAANYDAMMKLYLKSKEYTKAIAIILFCTPERSKFTGRAISKTVYEFCRKNNIEPPRSKNTFVHYMGNLRKSKLADHIIFRFSDPENGYGRTYEVEKEALENIEIKEVLRLCKIPGPQKEFIDKQKNKLRSNAEIRKEQEEKDKETKKRIFQLAKRKEDEVEKISTPKDVIKSDPEKSLDILRNLFGEKADGIKIIFTGDVHIHINNV